jgi:CRISPR system Cascade subunit CasA
MPVGEADAIAESLQQSYMGRLIPLGRFCLLNQSGLHYSEGIYHANYREGVFDPSTAVSFAQKVPKILWVDPQKRPWRQLTALLSFMGSTTTAGFDCHQISCGLNRAREQMPMFSIWSGGLRVSSNAGEQYVSGTDDYVESSITLQSEWLGDLWYEQLKVEMQELEQIAKRTYGATMGFFKAQQMQGAKQAAQCSNLFWQLCEREFQRLVDSCEDPDKTYVLRRNFAAFAYRAYDNNCPKETARQLDAWAKNRPNFSKYLRDTRREAV